MEKKKLKTALPEAHCNHDALQGLDFSIGIRAPSYLGQPSWMTCYELICERRIDSRLRFFHFSYSDSLHLFQVSFIPISIHFSYLDSFFLFGFLAFSIVQDKRKMTGSFPFVFLFVVKHIHLRNTER